MLHDSAHWALKIIIPYSCVVQCCLILYHKVPKPPKQPGIGVDLFQQHSFMDQIWRGITYEFITQSNALPIGSCPTLSGDGIAHGWLQLPVATSISSYA